MEYFPRLNWSAKTLPFLLTAPHAGETIPPEAPWLKEFPESTLLIDPDRFVDELYTPAANALNLPFLTTRVHRYAADLNRYPDDVDTDSVQGAEHASGKFPYGFHWVRTTKNHVLIAKPMTKENHRAIAKNYHDPFHAHIEAKFAELREAFPAQTLYHLDLHTMPSRGENAHKDAGKTRAEVVISDCLGKSASREYFARVEAAFRAEGFQIAINDPYQGGRITQRYGKPEFGVETIQIELNRAIYMNEETRERGPHFEAIQQRLLRALTAIVSST